MRKLGWLGVFMAVIALSIYAGTPVSGQQPQAQASSPQTPLRGVHFFPFGGLKRTAEWANKIAAGDFQLTDDQQGLHVA